MPACADNGIELRRDFVVKVTHDGKPLSGVTVQVTRTKAEENGTIAFFDMTASDGTVHIANLPAGEYWLDTEFLGFTAGMQCFHIDNRSSRKAKRAVRYGWGELAPSARQIAGKLIDVQPRGGVTFIEKLRSVAAEPIPEASLKLQNALTGTIYHTVSDQEGGFSFPPSPNGTYVLHLDGGTTPGGLHYGDGDILVRLSDTETEKMLLLKRISGVPGGCGAPYLSLEFRNYTK